MVQLNLLNRGYRTLDDGFKELENVVDAILRPLIPFKEDNSNNNDRKIALINQLLLDQRHKALDHERTGVMFHGAALVETKDGRWFLQSNIHLPNPEITRQCAECNAATEAHGREGKTMEIKELWFLGGKGDSAKDEQLLDDIGGYALRADETTRASWQDDRVYFISGEDHCSTMRYAGACAHLAYALGLAKVKDPDGVDWLLEATESWTWAQAHAVDQREEFVNARMYAAAALFRVTGDAAYEQQLYADTATMKVGDELWWERPYGLWLHAYGKTDAERTRGIALLRQAAKDQPGGASNNLAWLLCVSQHAGLRAPAEGVELAKALEKQPDLGPATRLPNAIARVRAG